MMSLGHVTVTPTARVGSSRVTPTATLRTARATTDPSPMASNSTPRVSFTEKHSGPEDTLHVPSTGVTTAHTPQQESHDDVPAGQWEDVGSSAQPAPDEDAAAAVSPSDELGGDVRAPSIVSEESHRMSMGVMAEDLSDDELKPMTLEQVRAQRHACIAAMPKHGALIPYTQLS
jgi:hypothetical protein